jgi:hypothetical protein
MVEPLTHGTDRGPNATCIHEHDDSRPRALTLSWRKQLARANAIIRVDHHSFTSHVVSLDCAADQQ